MKKEELLARETLLTDRFFDQLKRGGYSIARTSKEEGLGYDIISVEFDQLGIASDDVLAHVFFLPSPQDDMPINNFRVNITVADELENNELRPVMLQAISYVNFLIPIGAFVYDPSVNVLTYRRNCAIPVTLSEDESLMMMGWELFNGLSVVEPFLAPLLTLMSGEIAPNQFMEAVAVVMKLHAAQES